MLEVKNVKDSGEDFQVIEKMSQMNHEQLVFCNDKETGLKAIIAIHDTSLGPALGGTRMWNYNCDNDAIIDVLRLSRGMTFKAAITGLSLGGGKAVIIGDSSTQKTEALMRKFGEYVNSLGGKYITAEDVGMSASDMVHVKKETDFVTGIPVEMGGGGDPSPVTAFGVYMGMKAAANYKWSSDDLSSKKILVQGVGHVGENLVKHLSEDGAEVFINDINKENLQRVSELYNTQIVEGELIYDLDVDIYSPCALGATINDVTIDMFKCEIIAGAANNQLQDEDKHAKKLQEKGILYAPDFLINAGGLINVYSEINGYDREKAIAQTRKIYNTTLEIFAKSDDEKITTHQAALRLAMERIAQAKN
ncbi:MAG: Glu/Leu/Phe/Val dehydrogenase [Flavobacteriales bacterium]|jgi:leucine dehydrogenase|nr:Glu/Leu/Phe/Val dehydrogenase [Flavobacteriales bacterium]